MKKIIYYFVFVAIVLLSAACSQDFLDQRSTEYAGSEDMTDAASKNPATIANGYLTGIYYDLFKARASHDDFGLRAVMLATDLMTDDMAYNVQQWFFADYQFNNYSAANRRPRSTWNTFYEPIRGANSVIKVLKPQNGAELTDPAARNSIGQAYIARAYSYFWLINLWQQPYSVNKDAPGVPIYTEELDLGARQSVKDVYALILSDLDKGYNYLKGTTSPAGSFNEYSAAAIYAKVLCFVNDHPNQWDEVVKYSSLAMQGGSLLVGDALTNFKFNSVENSEVLWGAAITAETSTFYASFFSHMDATGPGYGGSLKQYKEPASELISAVKATDVRSRWLAKVGSTNTNNKFHDVGGFVSDYVYLRLAEMYYLKAEAQFLNKDEAGATNTLTSIMTTRDPAYTCSLSGQALLDEIQMQKRIEMWGDGCRFFDMKWRGEALDRTQSTNHFTGIVMNLPANSPSFIYQIPQAEIDANPNISASDQNPLP